MMLAPFLAVLLATTFPAFSGERVIVAGTDPAPYASVRAAIARLEAAGAPERFYVVVAATVEGDGPDPVLSYTNALYHAWEAESARTGRPLDGARSVVIVVALDRRRICVHPGASLERLGLAGKRIDAELVVPYFVPAARAGDIPQGIVRLLDGIETWAARVQGRARAGTIAVAAPAASSGTSSAPPIPAEAAGVAAPRRIGELPRVGGGRVATPPKPESRGRGWMAPASCLVAVLALLLAARAMLRRRRRVAMEPLDALGRRVGELMERGDALKARHALLAGLTGRSAEAVGAVGGEIRAFFESWAGLVETLERARSLFASAGLLGLSRLREAEALARSALSRETAGGAAEHIVTRLASLEAAPARAAEAIADAREDTVRASRDLARLAPAGIPGDAFVPDPLGEPKPECAAPVASATGRDDGVMGELTRALAVVEAALAEDPLFGEDVAARVGRSARRASRRALSALALLATADAVAAELRRVESEIEAAIAEGIRFAETAGDPAEPFARARAALDGVPADTAAAALERSEESLIVAAESGLEARERVLAVRAARQVCAVEASSLRGRLVDLDVRFRAARTALSRLQADHAERGFSALALELERAERRAGEVVHEIAAAEALARPETQRYLEARSRLVVVARDISAAVVAADRLPARLEELEALRARALGEEPGVAAEVGSSRRFRDEHAGLLLSRARALHSDAEAALAGARAALRRPAPDWPAALEALGATRDLARNALAAAREDVRDAEAAGSARRDALARIDEAAAVVAAHRSVRDAAREGIAEARSRLATAERERERGEIDWRALSERSALAGQLAADAERTAREDVELAARARTRLARSLDRIRAADCAYDRGVLADVSGAHASAREADAALARGDYEGAFRLADAAGAMAEAEAQAAAARVAAIIAAELEAERGRRAAEEAASGAAASSSWSASSSSFSPDASTSSSSFDSSGKSSSDSSTSSSSF